jgi:hypothetical protein
MAYVLEAITPQDQQKILKDAECDPIKKRNLTFAATTAGDFPKKWVIDRERNYYMFIPPQMVRPESTLISPRYFFFDGFMYEFLVPTFFGCEVESVDTPSESQLKKFQDEITAAFAVFGGGDSGPLNEFGDPEFAFVPVFKSKREA